MDNAPIDIKIALTLTVIPGTYNAEQIQADIISNLQGDAQMLGFGYGPEPYQVVSVFSYRRCRAGQVRLVKCPQRNSVRSTLVGVLLFPLMWVNLIGLRLEGGESGIAALIKVPK